LNKCVLGVPTVDQPWNIILSRKDHSMIQLTRAALLAALNNLVQAGATAPAPGVLNHVFIGLYTNAVTPGIGTLLSDLIEPTYPGYARQACTVVGTAYEDQGGDVVVDAPEFQFSMTDETVPTTIQGWFMASALTAGSLLGGERFAAPVVLLHTSQACPVAPSFNFVAGINLGTGVD
jgi:hypothetical protein